MSKKNKLTLFFLCNIGVDNMVIKTNLSFRARTSLSAAKKAFRHNKKLKDIFLIDENNMLYHHVSESFFTVKKEHKLNR